MEINAPLPPEVRGQGTTANKQAADGALDGIAAYDASEAIAFHNGLSYRLYENLLSSAQKDPALGGIVIGLLQFVSDEAVKQQKAAT